MSTTANIDSYKSLSNKIANKIELQIVSGLIRPNQKIPSERDLSTTFDVSRGTIRQAISHLAAKNLVVAKRGCGTVATSRGIFPQIDYSVVVTLTPISGNNFHLSTIIKALSSNVGKNNITMSWIDIGTTSEQEKEALNRIPNNIAGVVICPFDLELKHPALSRLEENKIPVVCIGESYVNYNFNSVHEDNFTAGYEISKHLLKNMHHNVAIYRTTDLSGKFSLGISDVIAGFEQAFGEAKCLFRKDLLWSTKVSKPHELQDELLSYLRKFPDVTAIFATNDIWASWCVTALSNNGIEVGRDIAMATMGSDTVYPFPTSLITRSAINENLVGIKVSEILDQNFSSGKLSCKEVVLTPSLIEAESTQVSPDQCRKQMNKILGKGE